MRHEDEEVDSSAADAGEQNANAGGLESARGAAGVLERKRGSGAYLLMQDVGMRCVKLTAGVRRVVTAVGMR